MCCIFTALIFFGPRLAFLVWWLIQPVRINATFNTFIWPLLGLIFLPWSTLMYVIVYGANGIIGIDWFWMALALIVDLVSYSGGVYNRKQVPYYAGP